MHEYGHYLQSQDYGLGYLFSVGVPSLISAMNSEKINEAPFSTHRLSWMERSANRKAKEYFGENYGVDWNQYYHPYNKNTPYTTIEDYYPTY